MAEVGEDGGSSSCDFEVSLSFKALPLFFGLRCSSCGRSSAWPGSPAAGDARDLSKVSEEQSSAATKKNLALLLQVAEPFDEPRLS